MHSTMTDFEKEYVLCKDNRLVLIGECLFAKASTRGLLPDPGDIKDLFYIL